MFATQSLADIEKSAIAPAIIESCPTRLFLPNERAIEPQILSIYRRFGLNDRQIEILARATPKRDYYCQSRRGNRLFELGLGEVALAFTAASSKTDQAAIAEVMLEHGRDGFAAAWLAARASIGPRTSSTPSSPRRTTSSHLPCGQSHEPSPHSAHGRDRRRVPRLRLRLRTSPRADDRL